MWISQAAPAVPALKRQLRRSLPLSDFMESDSRDGADFGERKHPEKVRCEIVMGPPERLVTQDTLSFL